MASMTRNAFAKVEVAVIGSGPAGLVAAWALQNDLGGKYNVTLFEMGNALSFDGHSYDYTNPDTGIRSRVDVPMRVLSGTYSQNAIRLLEHMKIETIEKRFLFAFAHDFAEVSRYYFLHASNTHRIPFVCRRYPGIMGFFSDLWTFILVVFYHFWFTFACFWKSPRVRSPKHATTETIGEYLNRLMIPNFFVEDYITPIYSTLMSSTHKAFLQIPAIYLTDYKRQTYKKMHRAIPAMPFLQKQLSADVTIIRNARITLVQSHENHLKLYYHNMDTGASQEMKFDKVVLATDPKQTSAIFPPASYVMDKLHISDITVALHRDYDMLPEESMKHVRDTKSELFSLQSKIDTWGRKITLATHAHPHGLLATSWPGFSETMSIDPRKILHTSRFVQVLSTPETRDNLASLFRSREGEKDTSSWHNGDDEVWLVGGWAWDGFDSFEGAVWSALSTARSVGAVLPFEPVDRKWRGGEKGGGRVLDRCVVGEDCV